MSTFEERQARVTVIRSVIEAGEIENATGSQLSDFSKWLCDPAIQGHFNGQDYHQICELVRHHMLRNLIDDFERRSNVMQYWVVALAVAALIASIVQAGVAIWAELRVSRGTAPSVQMQSAPAARSAPAPFSSSSAVSAGRQEGPR